MSFQNAFLGSLVADAISMPVHWYYDTGALDRDYGLISNYLPPKNPHPDSILWRSQFKIIDPKIDILHGQKKYWGTKGIHYHQHLQAGENTLNLQIAAELYRFIIRNDGFDIKNWLERYAHVMLTPDWHNDTYIEEYHRKFFENYARGKPLLACGSRDYHIGALSLIPGLLAGLEAIGQTEPDYILKCTTTLVKSTHNDDKSIKAANQFARLLITLNQKIDIRPALELLTSLEISIKSFGDWSFLDDRKVVGEILSKACYLPDSFKASIYLAWKYHNQFSEGVFANATVGGDNCHRGVVVGSVLGIANGIPQSLLKNLIMKNQL